VTVGNKRIQRSEIDAVDYSANANPSPTRWNILGTNPLLLDHHVTSIIDIA